MIPRSSIHPFDKDVPRPVNVEGRVTEMATAPNVGTSESTDKAVRVVIFDIAHYWFENLHIKVNQINNREIRLHDISNAIFLALLQIFRAYGFEHA